ncbi:MAG: hypothetical protein QNK23_13750 [Crocinitomicaceae bacterium]|nr:hypothetical protein [Crocinitomicaceae bacterium]
MGTTILLGCNKYENGPSFTLLTKKTRLVREWSIEEILFNNEIIIFNGNVMNSTYSFENDGDYIVSDPLCQKGTWEFDSDKENVLIMIDGNVETYIISGLKDKSLWLKKESLGGTLLFKYVPSN